jgi:hypothetical protein
LRLALFRPSELIGHAGNRSVSGHGLAETVSSQKYTTGQ